MILTILATAVLLGVLIFVHELGHFVTAKLVDIRVPRFSIGFGPKIFGFRRGETEYVLSWIPLGGYVKMAGMEEMEAIEGGDDADVDDRELEAEPEDDDVSRHFESKSLPARFLVISAGVLMNFLFAVAVWAVIASTWGVPQEMEAVIARVDGRALPDGAGSLADLPPGARITAVGNRPVESRDELIAALVEAPEGDVVLRLAEGGTRRITLGAREESRQALLQSLVPPWPAVIGDVIEGGPADRAGIMVGDTVVAVDGDTVFGYRALVDLIEASPDRPLTLAVRRADGRRTLALTPEPQTVEGEVVGRIGVASYLPREHHGLVSAVGYGLEQAVHWTAYIGRVLWRLITGQESARNLGGPVLIGDLAGQFARAGLAHFLNFMAIFSINLAVLNLLPIPVLDGGHILFLSIEAVRGRALSLRQRIRLSNIGMVILVAIMVLALANDLIRLVENWVQ